MRALSGTRMAQTSKPEASPDWSAAAPLRVGIVSLVVLVVCGIGLWSLFTNISGAVVSHGPHPGRIEPPGDPTS